LATTVYTIEEVALQDDSKVQLKPLNIKTLRQFMKVMEDFGDPDKTEQESFEKIFRLDLVVQRTSVKYMRKRQDSIPNCSLCRGNWLRV
jgi:hypothetical protein